MSWSKNKNTVAARIQGTFTLNGTTAVVVAPVVELGATSTIILTLVTAGGTQTGHPYLSATPTTGVPGTCSITVKGTGSLDTSVYGYTIIG